MKMWVFFQAKAVKNGDGNRSGLLYMETSTDGGFSWHSKKLVAILENKNTAYSDYTYLLAGSAGSRNGVNVRFSVERSDGEGTSPQVTINHVEIKANYTDNVAPEIIDATVQTSKRIRVTFNDYMNNASMTNIANYSGVPSISKITANIDNTILNIDLNDDLADGKEYLLTLHNVSDKAGNNIKANTQASFIYNGSNPNIFITEIMYNTPVFGEDSLEFLEIYNQGNSAALLGGLSFKEGLDMTFPEYTLPPNGYVLIAKNARAAKNLYGQEFLQWESGALDNAGEKLTIINSKNQIITTVKYKNTWGGHGDGHSISYCSPGNQSLNSEEAAWSQTTTPLNKSHNHIPIFVSPGKGCGNTTPEIRFSTASNYVVTQPATIKVKIVVANSNQQTSSADLSIDAQASTAIFNQDFTSNITIPSTISFNGETSKEFEIQISTIPNQDEIKTVVFNLTQKQNAIIGGNASYEIIILNKNAPISQVCINEISSSNNSLSGILDEFGDADDWIELKNNSNQDIPLAGYYVSDNLSNPTKYQIPVEDMEKTTIPANGYLILWADKETNQGVNHLDFKLSATEGESFILTMPDGETAVEEITFPPLQTNTSYGRKEDCAEEWIVFKKPTFGTDNAKGDPATSVILRKNAPNIVLYPNPNNGSVLYISEPLTYTLYNQTGQMLKRDIMTTQVDISALPSGLYFIQTDDGLSAKFIIHH
ncbi:MAG: lamin tail domain-containing protein [Chitinophagales bacterium]|nr:lamin tail domain-containing protein [Chitinophagales bacterium]